jgi:hypothetical protein
MDGRYVAKCLVSGCPKARQGDRIAMRYLVDAMRSVSRF